MAAPSRRIQRLALVPVLLAGLAAAAPASAATMYGGTTSVDQYPLILKVSGTRIVGVVSMWRGACASGRAYSFGRSVSLASHPLAIRAGAFAGSFAVAETLSGGQTGMVTVTLKGRVRGAKVTGSLTGAASVVSSPAAPPDDTCTTKSLAFTLAHRPGTVYGGTTSQGLPVVVELVSSRTQIHHLHVGWRATCTSGGAFQYADFLAGGALTRGGAFGGTFTTNDAGSAGSTYTSDYAVSGRLTKTSGNGALKVTVTQRDAAGTVQDTCTTGSVTFHVTG